MGVIIISPIIAIFLLPGIGVIVGQALGIVVILIVFLFVVIAVVLIFISIAFFFVLLLFLPVSFPLSHFSV